MYNVLLKVDLFKNKLHWVAFFAHLLYKRNQWQLLARSSGWLAAVLSPSQMFCLDYVSTGAISQSALADTGDGDLWLIELNGRLVEKAQPMQAPKVVNQEPPLDILSLFSSINNY